jgi:hypothetical protein
MVGPIRPSLDLCYAVVRGLVCPWCWWLSGVACWMLDVDLDVGDVGDVGVACSAAPCLCHLCSLCLSFS